jgi:hypothetical protein
MSQADSINTTGNAVSTVVQMSNYRSPPPKRKRVKSLYEKYPLPFFDRKQRNCWAIKGSGNYTVDCETGHRLAREFLASHDGTYGWQVLLQTIVMDMIRAGPPAERWPDGRTHTDGIVIGFMSVISSYVMAGLHEWGPPAGTDERGRRA